MSLQHKDSDNVKWLSGGCWGFSWHSIINNDCDYDDCAGAYYGDFYTNKEIYEVWNEGNRLNHFYNKNFLHTSMLVFVRNNDTRC